MTTMYVFRDLDLSRDGVFQQNEADAFKATLQEKLKVLAGEDGKFDTAAEFQAAKDAGFDISFIPTGKLIPVSSESLNDTPPARVEDTSRSDNEYALGQGDRKSEYDDDEKKPSANISGALLEDANKRGFIDTYRYGKSYSLDSVVNNFYNKSVGKVVGKSLADKASFDSDSQILITDHEAALFRKFKAYAKLNASGVLMVDQAGAQKLIQSYKLPGDTLPATQLDPNSQKALLVDTEISCGKTAGETCTALNASRPVFKRNADGTLDKKNPITEWAFYDFFKKV